MHSNIHHENMNQLDLWYDHMKTHYDFWPIAYYPYYIKESEWGLPLEDLHNEDVIDKDWEVLRSFTNKANEDGYPMFMGYEWQGSGNDGDHNVFFGDNQQNPIFPYELDTLIAQYKGIDVMGIPHHPAYELGCRGKNWRSHNEEFSPFVEIFSSHGSSENDYGALAMTKHIHMGPRTGGGTLEDGLNLGYKLGIIASGDNHSVPGIPKHGLMCVLAPSNSKKDLWMAMRHRRVYGVSNSKILLDFYINNSPMGSSIQADDNVDLYFNMIGSAAIDSVEVLRNNIVEKVITHSGTWERCKLPEIFRAKFKVDFGWGPDTRIYHDIKHRNWNGSIGITHGSIESIEHCFYHLNQRITQVSSCCIDFELTSYKTTASGKWMGLSEVETEGLIIEIAGSLDTIVTITVDDKDYKLTLEQILGGSHVFALWDEVYQLTESKWGHVTHYRKDPFWHNAYKILVSKGSPHISYELDQKITVPIDLHGKTNYRIRGYQVNGDMVWSSPIFINYAT